ncbi:hypothetical protein [Pseudoruegeria sp. HB172150]|uniref:hypothetical protein n=1 Tax=Pseudoruegeria sp. HB172150 TaxID=2721164 RepID=UPI0015573B76|nr:hypothetical protein [Pseudoruegeria sp. HB172150]
MTTLPDLASDCNACAALCCVGLAFDEGDDFAIDKPAGLPCPHLGTRHDCTIYEYLEEEGFPGCVRYECEGAGQRAITLHGGESWRDDLELLAPMLETFRHLRTIHSLLTLLDTARRLPLEEEEEDRWEHLMESLCPDEMTPDVAAEIASGTILAEARDFLRSLAHHV